MTATTPTAAWPILACAAPDAHVADATDCDDAEAGAHPSADEVRADDDDEAASGRVAHYVDDDSDGFGIESGAATLYCDPPPGWSPTADDCDDTDAVRNPAGWPGTTVRQRWRQHLARRRRGR